VELLLEPRVRSLQLCGAFLERRHAALRDEGDDERDDRREDERQRQEEEKDLRHGILKPGAPLFLGEVLVVDVAVAAEEERVAAGPAAIGPRADPVGAVGAEPLAAHGAAVQLRRFADPLATTADVAPGAFAIVREGHVDIIRPRIWYHSRLCGRLVAM
jgi:hypothetical protein